MISESEILDALRSAMVRSDADGFTSLDIADALNCSQGNAQRIIARLGRAGRVVYAGERHTSRMDGRPGRSPVYRLAQAIDL